MCKFKIGDKVKRIKCDYMDVTVGGVYEISEISASGLKLAGCKYTYDHNNFELVEENMNKQFTKDMLVAGKHVVRYTKDGELGLVLESHRGKFLMYYEDTTYSYPLGTEAYCEVYEIAHPCERLDLNNSNLKLIWRREEKSQSQIELEELQKQISELQEQAKRLEKSL